MPVQMALNLARSTDFNNSKMGIDYKTLFDLTAAL